MIALSAVSSAQAKTLIARIYSDSACTQPMGLSIVNNEPQSSEMFRLYGSKENVCLKGDKSYAKLSLSDKTYSRDSILELDPAIRVTYSSYKSKVQCTGVPISIIGGYLGKPSPLSGAIVNTCDASTGKVEVSLSGNRQTLTISCEAMDPASDYQISCVDDAKAHSTGDINGSPNSAPSPAKANDANSLVGGSAIALMASGIGLFFF